MQLASQVPLQRLDVSWARAAGIELWVRRDDLIHPTQSGNKFYKLYFNLRQARLGGYSQVLSFGGPWSNHLHALAAAGSAEGLQTLAVIRGEAPVSLNHCLAEASEWGMRLQFVSRTDYSAKQDTEAIHRWVAGLDKCLVVPEGGANLFGAAGMQVSGQAIEAQLNGAPADICLACGTGTSLAGVAAGVDRQRRVLGFPVLKPGTGANRPLAAQIEDFWRALCPKSQVGIASNWRLLWGFHGGGYGRKPKLPLFEFWRAFEAESGLQLDPVYTLKLFWGIYSLVKLGYWPKGQRLVAIHTGGLQGRRGFVCP